jgi:hypothetical protein
LWETGAVYGAALGTVANARPRVRPLRYAVDPERLPEPLRAANLQLTRGDSEPEMRQFMRALIDDLDVLDSRAVLDAGAVLEKTVAAYVADVQTCLAVPRFDGPSAHPEMLEDLLGLTVTAIQAFAPRTRMNGRYFYAALQSDRRLLIRQEDIYYEGLPMPGEFGLESVDIERDAETIVICKSYIQRKPIYEVLSPELLDRYDPEIKSNIDPEQGWVLACPVIAKGRDPLGVICLYGEKPPARSDEQVRSLCNVAAHLSEVFSRLIAPLEARTRRSG